jgi:RimJ/RimL family protein N-acetyltransferase
MIFNSREVISSDAKLLFEWANNPVTRQASFHSDPIELEDHVNWLKNTINSVERKIYLISVLATPVAIVRFDKNEKTVIGITVSPEYRGKGLAADIIQYGCQRYVYENREEEIYAYIKIENTASLKAFEKAGFVYSDEGMCNDQPCKIFILKSYGKK